ncbi:MAG: hypothetical protein OXT64_10550 [Gammaproteobacteria bacterium]|nr:hypothetical protein [Gammaproteobacteria bacterium]
MTRHERLVVEHLSPEIVSILAVGDALAGLILTGLHGLRAELNAVRVELNAVRTELNDVRAYVTDLRERVARLEGLFEGFIKVFEGFIQKAAPHDPASN